MELFMVNVDIYYRFKVAIVCFDIRPDQFGNELIATKHDNYTMKKDVYTQTAATIELFVCSCK